MVGTGEKCMHQAQRKFLSPTLQVFERHDDMNSSLQIVK